MDTKDTGTWAALVVMVVAIVAAACGWFMNIINLLHNGDAMNTWELVIRIGGVFMTPIGAVLGYF